MQCCRLIKETVFMTDNFTESVHNNAANILILRANETPRLSETVHRNGVFTKCLTHMIHTRAHAHIHTRTHANTYTCKLLSIESSLRQLVTDYKQQIAQRSYNSKLLIQGWLAQY